MADTGYKWPLAFSAMQKGAADWTDDALADNATETGDPLSQNAKAATEITIKAVEDNTGAIDGVCTVFVLGDIDGTNYEDPAKGNPFSFSFTPIQNDTVRIRFRILGCDYSRFKIAVKNESGQELAITIKYQQSTIPVAS